jgi:hypothetical protein
MYEPPAGFIDLQNDAARAPLTGDFEDLTVPGLGPIRARRPLPRAVSALASAANGKYDAPTRNGYLNMFVVDHLGLDAFEDLLVDLVTGTVPADAVHRVARAIATWGTARPYVAVGTLAVITAHHWRTVRARCADNGISDPLVSFSSMHALLDVTERIVLESLAHSGEGKDAHKQAKRNIDEFLDRMYAPELDAATAINEDGYAPVPAGFDEDSMEDSFDAFLKGAR